MKLPEWSLDSVILCLLSILCSFEISWLCWLSQQPFLWEIFRFLAFHKNPLYPIKLKYAHELKSECSSPLYLVDTWPRLVWIQSSLGAWPQHEKRGAHFYEISSWKGKSTTRRVSCLKQKPMGKKVELRYRENKRSLDDILWKPGPRHVWIHQLLLLLSYTNQCGPLLFA